MTPQRVGRRHVVGAISLWCAIVLSVASVTCNRSTSPPANVTPALRTVSLPELSNTADAVQTSIRERHATLQQTLARSDISAADRAAAYGEMGKLFLAAEFYEAAGVCFDNARVLAPGDMKWPYYLGHVARLKSDTAQAVSWFERARTLQPGHVPTLVWLADLYVASNRVDDAEALLVKAESLEPGSGAVRVGLGRVALARQDYRRAATQLEDALRLAPSASSIHYPLALAYRGLGDTRAAEAHLKQRGNVELPPADPLMADVSSLLQNAAAYETRGSQALEGRQWPEAIENLTKASQLAPANAYTRLNLGTALYMKGDADRALEEYREAVRLAPDLARAHFGIGVVMEARGNDRDAIAAFTTAVSRDPAYTEARFSLANALRRNGRVEESLSHYAEVLRANPAVSQASFGYAMGLVRLGRYQDARARLQQGAQAFPDQPGFAHALARVLAAAPDDRVRDGSRALAIATDLLKIQRTAALDETMAMALAELARFDEAVKWQREALAMSGEGAPRAVVTRLTQNLRGYESRRPCRVPWADDDPVHHPRPSS
jgi:tetratricopeptide (TPR) repeat protein